MSELPETLYDVLEYDARRVVEEAQTALKHGRAPQCMVDLERTLKQIDKFNSQGEN